MHVGFLPGGGGRSRLLAVGLLSLLALLVVQQAGAAVPTYSDAVLADTPVSYYRLGDALGATSAANSGSSSTAATFPATGVDFGVTGAVYGSNTAVKLHQAAGATAPTIPAA